MEPTEFQLFKGYIRYLVEEHISTVIFAAHNIEPLREWDKIQPWNRSEQDLWNCFEDFNEWKNGLIASEVEIFKDYIRYIFKNYINDFFKMVAQTKDLRYIEPWRQGEKDIWECFEFDPFEKFVDDHLRYLRKVHMGDCTGMATTCARCVAEEYFK